MTKDQAREWMSKIGHREIKLDCDMCHPGTVTVEGLFRIFQTLMRKDDVSCDTCKYLGKKGYECKECKQFSYWEEKEN